MQCSATEPKHVSGYVCTYFGDFNPHEPSHVASLLLWRHQQWVDSSIEAYVIVSTASTGSSIQTFARPRCGIGLNLCNVGSSRILSVCSDDEVSQSWRKYSMKASIQFRARRRPRWDNRIHLSEALLCRPRTEMSSLWTWHRNGGALPLLKPA